jgi:hypothetical protein
MQSIHDIFPGPPLEVIRVPESQPITPSRSSNTGIYVLLAGLALAGVVIYLLQRDQEQG